jgi:Myb-like DNA-binding domain
MADSNPGSSAAASQQQHSPPPPPNDDFASPLAEAAALLMGDPASNSLHHHAAVPGLGSSEMQHSLHQQQQHFASQPQNQGGNNNNMNNNNKWNKNGFGAVVQKQSGKFSRAESELVRRAVEEYCHAKQIPTSRLCSECDHKAELKGAWMEIAKRLPHRSVQSVYRHGIRQLHPFKRGAWSDEECFLLADLVQKLGKKWSSIQSKLNRSADSCRDKYREMSDEFIKGRWKEHDTEMLKRVIREQVSTGRACSHFDVMKRVDGSFHCFDLRETNLCLPACVAASQLNVGPDMDMKEVGRLVEEQGIQISWSVVSKRMGNRSRLSCFKKWQKLSGVMGNLMGDVDVDAHHPAHHLHHHDSGLMKRGRRGGDDDDDEDDDDDDFSGLHGDHPLAAGGAPPNKRSKVGEKIEFPQAATAGAAAALAHQHTAQQQHHHHHHQQLQHFNHHHPTHMGMAGTALQQQRAPSASSPSQPMTTSTAAPSAASAAGANSSSSLSNPFRNVVQPTNEVYFDASQAEAIMEAVKLPDPGRLK